MSDITLTLPDDAATTLKVAPEKLPEELLLAAAMKLYEIGRISSGKAAELAGIPRVVFEEKLADYGIATFKLSPEELRRDAGLA